MKIAMANDHAGTSMKYEIKAWLEAQGHTVEDFGTYDEGSCDLSDYVLPAALAVAKRECDRGIFVDGVGYGSAMIANKVNGIYACVCQDPFCAQLARQHNDANVLCLGAKIIGGMIAMEIVKRYVLRRGEVIRRPAASAQAGDSGRAGRECPSARRTKNLYRNTAPDHDGRTQTHSAAADELPRFFDAERAAPCAEKASESGREGANEQPPCE